MCYQHLNCNFFPYLVKNVADFSFFFVKTGYVFDMHTDMACEDIRHRYAGCNYNNRFNCKKMYKNVRPLRFEAKFELANRHFALLSCFVVQSIAF